MYPGLLSVVNQKSTQDKNCPLRTYSRIALIFKLSVGRDIAAWRTKPLTCFTHPVLQSITNTPNRTRCILFGCESPPNFREEQMAYQIFSILTLWITNKINIHGSLLCLYQKSCSYLCLKSHFFARARAPEYRDSLQVTGEAPYCARYWLCRVTTWSDHASIITKMKIQNEYLQSKQPTALFYMGRT